ncbi:glycosyltransferase [Lachnobacterium bovis]|uniref:Glycosyl transferase family 2 n=1 Tax=Lachnobacterium bovis TaxID=140626 RepID=A0A1H9NZX0_9FIRM|nr:glycosyltransferase [Lachnobacterium bovis]SER41478.1 Glycosyl transferase family 2 [Lachnobacterium bovis]
MGISVLMSVYKKEKPSYFKEALMSIINQTLQPDEIVLIKDGPLTDELEEVILDCLEIYPNIKTFQFKENVQLGLALQKGVKMCSNSLIARMDTDDIARKNRLQLQYEFLRKNTDVAVCGGAIQEFYDNGSYKSVKKMPQGFQNVRNYGKYRNPVNHMTVMFRKDAILDAGNYRHYPKLEDYDLWIRTMAKGYKLDNLSEILVEARTNEDFYSRRGGAGYGKRYLKLRSLEHKLKITNFIEYIISCILTVAMVYSPTKMRKVFYRKALRSKGDN